MESDYYKIFKEVIKLTYLEGNSVILFKCQQFDNKHSMKVDLQHGLIEIKHGLKAYVNELFMMAQQAVQVYYTHFPSRERGRKEWQAVCKIKSQAIHYMLKEKEEPYLLEYFQEDETSAVY